MPDLLRETFEEYARRAPSADGLRAGIDARRRHRARRTWAVTAGAVATAAAVLAGVAIVDGTRGTPPAPLASGVAPAGTTWVAWHGVEVAVPTGWIGGAIHCGEPQEDTVRYDGEPTLLCLPPQRDGLDVVSFGTVASAVGVLGEQASSKGTTYEVDGVEVRRITGRTKRLQHVEALVVESHDMYVAVSSDDPATIRRVLDTARVRDVDSYGCEAKPARLYASPPSRPGADAAMVPSGFTGASLCRYVGGWTARSARLDAATARSVAGVLNGLAPGFTPVPENARDDAESAGEAIVATFRYAGGADVSVYVHVNGTHSLGATNGAVTGRLSTALQEAMTPHIGWFDGWSGHLY